MGINLLRGVSVLEGLSLLYLLFCSIYLKRMKGIEEAIETPGAIHGALFLLFSALLFLLTLKKKFKIQFAILAFISSLCPLGFLWLESQLKKVSKY